MSPHPAPQSTPGSADADPHATAGDVARAVAGAGFGRGSSLPTAPLPDEVFASFLAITEYDRLLGAAAQLVYEGDLPVTDDQRRALGEVHTSWLHHDLTVERLLLEVGDRFDRAGIDCRVLKGAAHARLLYEDPSWRVFGDLDVLVPSGRFDEAVRLTRVELGGKQPVPELRPGFDHEFGKEALVRFGSIELDLHRTFVSGPFGLTIDLDSLFDGGTPVEIGGRSFTALEPTALFLHTCYNLALGDHPVRLCSLRDLLLATRRLDVDVADIANTARAWRATAAVQRAAQLALDTLHLELDPGHPLPRLARLPVPKRETWLLRSYLGAARSYSRPLAALAVIPGVRARFRYARALLAPSAEYLGSRGWSERSHLRRARERMLRRG